MTEKLLHFIWQFQYFSRTILTTTSGDRMEIIFQGRINHHQGPDFLHAKIRLQDKVWAGNVELHVKSSDWSRHQHSLDPHYQNVILHVVWIHDEERAHTVVNDHDIPVLEMQNRVPKILLQRYEFLMMSGSFIPCGNSINSVSIPVWESWKERLLVERLMKKTNAVESLLQLSNFHWEECFWWLLARNFGTKVNASSFETIARSLPIRILARHKNQIHQLEALFFGQAGLLEEKWKEDYPIMLQKEYRFLKDKYQLKQAMVPVYFLRMRPGNFPTIRLAQLASLVMGSVHLFSKVREATSIADLKKMLEVQANDYWHYHYQFDEPGEFRLKQIGKSMAENLIINTIVPAVFAYGNYHQEINLKMKAVRWLQELSAEDNSIIKGFRELGLGINNAADSQSMIELKTAYCQLKNCLSCAVGNSILKLRGGI